MPDRKKSVPVCGLFGGPTFPNSFAFDSLEHSDFMCELMTNGAFRYEAACTVFGAEFSKNEVSYMCQV